MALKRSCSSHRVLANGLKVDYTKTEAALLFTDLCRIDSTNTAIRSDCHTNLANYFLTLQPDLKQALKHLRSASELSPNDGEVRYNFGLALEKDGQLELALENYLRAEELGVDKDISTLIRNAGAKLLKRNSAFPPTQEELEALKEDEKSMGTQVDYGPHGNGR